MSFFDDALGFVLGTKKSSSDQSQTGSQQTNSTTSLNSTTKTTNDQTQTGTTASLDPASLKILQGALGSVASGIKSGPEIADAIAASQAEAQRGFDVDTMQKIHQAAQKIGSEDNTIPLMLQNKAREDLAIQLNAISKNTILGQSNTSAQLLAALGSVVKGGTVSSATTSAGGSTTTVNAVQQLISDIISQQSGQQSGQTNPTLGGFIGQFSSLAGGAAGVGAKV